MNNPVFKLASLHPRVTAWLVLSIGMVGMLLFFGSDVGLTLFNWISLIIATVLTAGLCILIISWEDEEDLAEEDNNTETESS